MHLCPFPDYLCQLLDRSEQGWSGNFGLTLSDSLVLENVESFELDLERLEDLHQLAAEPALGRVRSSLHEDHDRGFANQPLQPVIEVLGWKIPYKWVL